MELLSFKASGQEYLILTADLPGDGFSHDFYYKKIQPFV